MSRRVAFLVALLGSFESAGDLPAGLPPGLIRLRIDRDLEYAFSLKSFPEARPVPSRVRRGKERGQDPRAGSYSNDRGRQGRGTAGKSVVS